VVHGTGDCSSYRTVFYVSFHGGADSFVTFRVMTLCSLVVSFRSNILSPASARTTKWFARF
jgi:hypothetical protein